MRGFTLLELMVTLAVAGVLVTIGVPSFFDIVRNNRAATNANEMVTAFTLARSEAIRRGARIGVCSSADQANCGGTWSDGWIVFVDAAATDTAAVSLDEVLRVWPGPSGEATVDAGAAWVRFLPRGNMYSPGGSTVTYTIEFDDCNGLQGRSIEINAVGRTTVERVNCT
ncbi:MAG: GspH/FimT family pseudopilin [Gammaproteobacteria bacterium]|nr:GspH/FimT family pseudopilin [Gammaproteobacteria bacterium]